MKLILASLMLASTVSFAKGSSHPKRSPEIMPIGAPCSIQLPLSDRRINATMYVSIAPTSYRFMTEHNLFSPNKYSYFEGVSIKVGNSTYEISTQAKMSQDQYIQEFEKLIEQKCSPTNQGD